MSHIREFRLDKILYLSIGEQRLRRAHRSGPAAISFSAARACSIANSTCNRWAAHLPSPACTRNFTSPNPDPPRRNRASGRWRRAPSVAGGGAGEYAAGERSHAMGSASLDGIFARIGQGQRVVGAVGGSYTVFCARRRHYASQEAPKRTD
jgi:hypothetical protein